MRYGKLILALSSVAMLVGCSEKQAEISQGMKDIDRQKDIQKEQVRTARGCSQRKN